MVCGVGYGGGACAWQVWATSIHISIWIYACTRSNGVCTSTQNPNYTLQLYTFNAALSSSCKLQAQHVPCLHETRSIEILVQVCMYDDIWSQHACTACMRSTTTKQDSAVRPQRNTWWLVKPNHAPDIQPCYALETVLMCCIGI